MAWFPLVGLECGLVSSCGARTSQAAASLAKVPGLWSTARNGLSCSVTCEIFRDQGLNLCLLHRQVDSLPLSHQGSPLLHYIPEINMIMSTKHHFTKKKKKLVLRLPLNVDFRGHFQQAIWLASSKKSIFLQNFILKIHSNSHSETFKLCLLQLIQI